MDIEFIDSDEIPVPPEEVKFREVEAELLADRRRVRLTINLTPFQEPPDIEISAVNPAGHKAAETTIIGAPAKRMSLTLHLRDEGVEGAYRFLFVLGYQDLGTVDRTELELIILDPGESTLN